MSVQQVALSFSTLVSTTLLAIPTSLTFEFPVTQLQHILLGKFSYCETHKMKVWGYTVEM